MRGKTDVNVRIKGFGPPRAYASRKTREFLEARGEGLILRLGIRRVDCEKESRRGIGRAEGFEQEGDHRPRSVCDG